jgi:type IV pilus assembly protein PilM
MAIKQSTQTILDIGTNHVKMLQLNGSGKINKFAIERLPEGCIKGLFIEAEEPLVRSLKAARYKSGVSGGKCTLTLSGKDMIVRHLTLPRLPDKQLYQNVLLEMAGYLPVDSEKHAMDYKIIEEITENNAVMYRIMVATLHKRILEHFSAVLKGAGFSLKTLDANENAQEKFIRNVVLKRLPENEGKGICVIDMGADTTKVNIFKNGRFFVGYLLNRGGNNITGIVAQNLETDAVTAENYKTKTDFFEDDSINALLRTAVKNEIDTLIYEISKVADFYWSRANEALGSVILTGGGSLMTGIEDYFRANISIPIYNAAAFLESAAARKGLSPTYYPYLFNAYAASFREE